MNRTWQVMEDTEKYLVHNYDRYPVVIESGRGVWVWDLEGKDYIDMLSAYSALNYGHCHPKVVEAIQKQASKLLITSGNFYNPVVADAAKALRQYVGKDKVLFSSGGAESVEVAIKISRKWGYDSFRSGKNINNGDAEIVVCRDNFHGRTTTIVGFSSVAQYRRGFGPFGPTNSFREIEFGNPDALARVINENTVAFLVEPIQGEGGINIPPEGYLKEVRRICTENNVLLVLDEIQTGFGRTGADFVYQYEGIEPDILIVGKSLGGGYPVSAVLANSDIMGVIGVGHHGSTFGANPLACALVLKSLDILENENLSVNATLVGNYFMRRLREMKSPYVKEVRGRGLFIGVELMDGVGDSHKFCQALIKEGVLCTGARENVIRFTPPLIISVKEIDQAMERIKKVLGEPR